MAQIKAITARGLLEDLAQVAKVAALTLPESIRAARSGVYTPSFKAGKITINTSGHGQSASFLVPTLLSAEFSPARVADQYQEFLEIWNDAVSAGAIADQTPSGTDAALAVMLTDDRLQTVNRRGTDFTLVNWPQTSQVAGQ